MKITEKSSKVIKDQIKELQNYFPDGYDFKNSWKNGVDVIADTQYFYESTIKSARSSILKE